jgi:hypothetical protein
VGSEADFDRYVAEHNIPEEELPEAFARWIADQTGGPPPRFERVEPGDEQILEDRSQRDLDSVRSALYPEGEDLTAAEERTKATSADAARGTLR